MGVGARGCIAKRGGKLSVSDPDLSGTARYGARVPSRLWRSSFLMAAKRIRALSTGDRYSIEVIALCIKWMPRKQNCVMVREEQSFCLPPGCAHRLQTQSCMPRT